MQARNEKVSHFLNKTQQFTIPIFQRKYSWTRDQCKQLLEDVIRVGSDNEENHFIGSFVHLSEDDDIIPTYRVIDGQQRITTLILLISALSDYIKENEFDFDITPKKLINYYLVNDNEEGELFYKLKLNDKDNRTLKKIINHLANDEKLNFDKNDSEEIKNNFNFFKREINEENLRNVFEGFKKLLIIVISLSESTDNPQLIFESLNSTGLPLSKSDLIRNFVLMGLTPFEQDKIYKEYWQEMEDIFEDSSESFDDFIKDYLTINIGRIPVQREIYTEFKRYAQDLINSNDLSKFENIKNLVKDIYKYAHFFSKFTMGKEENYFLNYAFTSLYELRRNVTHVFLLQLYNDYDKGLLNLDEFIKIVEIMESYLIRRFICDLEPNSLRKTFAELYNELDKENYLESFKVALLLKKNVRRMPDNREFGSHFRNKDIYNLKRNTKYILRKLENFGFEKEPTNVNAYTIEHIMPQNPNLSIEWQDTLGPEWERIQKEYLHTIGNLTLTGYNETLSDRPFLVKRDIDGGFKKSSIRLNVDLQDLNTWNEEEILKRTERLVQLSYKVWEYPKVDQEILDKYIEKLPQTKSKVVEDVGEINLLEGQYWERFNQYTLKNSEIFNRVTAYPRPIHVIGIGSGQIEMRFTFNSRNEISSRVHIIDNKPLFDYLYDLRQEIEDEIGLELEWDRTDQYKSSQIRIFKYDIDFFNEEKWDEYIKWQVDVGEKMIKVFLRHVNDFI